MPTFRVLATLILLVGRSALASGAPENVVLVVNGESWESRCIANEYRVLRQVPASHLIEITGLSSRETIGIEEFRERVLAPVTQAIEDRQLMPQVEYVLYSADIPTAVRLESDFKDVKLPQVLTKTGSVTGLTYLHSQVRAKDLRYIGLQSNRYLRRVVLGAKDTPWTAEEQKQFVETVQAFQKLDRSARRAGDKRDEQAEAEKLAQLAESLESLRQAHPQSPDLLYNLACARVLQDKTETALEVLKQAVDAGFLDARHAEGDSDLAALRYNKTFRALLRRMRETPLTLQPTRGFHADAGWNERGEPVSRAEGATYWLSTVLAVTSGRGLPVSRSLDQLRRSVAADGSRPSGTIYFEQNGDVRSTTREWAFRPAAQRLEQLGVKAVIERGVLPRNRDDVAGAVIGTADFDWSKSGSRILPGAICEHLTSLGGILTSGAGQTPLTEFLRHGAAGASGTVTEPYAVQPKFPTPFIHVFYAEGCTLGEAFYQSLAGPYQLLIVGDALCRPWGKRLEVQVAGLPDSPLSGTVALQPQATSPDKVSVETWELFLDGRRTQRVPSGESLSLETTHLDEGHHDLSIVAVGADPVRSSGRWRRAIQVQNTQRRITLESPKTTADWDQPFTFRVSATGAKRVELQAGTRIVGQRDGEAGEITVNSKDLGPGPSEVIAVARFESGRPVRSVPVIVRVGSPEE